MRYFLLLLPFLFFPVVGAQAAPDDTPQSVLRLARTGAPQLALTMAQRAQKTSSDRAHRLAWDAVQWELLHQLKRWPELLEQTGSVPPDAGDAMRRQTQWWNVRAAVALRHDVEARAGLARMLWQGGLDAVQTREARLLVIETCFSSGRIEEAYLSILRFRQDYSPLSRGEASAFAQGLAVNGKAAQALPLLPLLGEGPLELLVRLRAGMVPSATAIPQARAAVLEKGGDAGYWAVLAQAAISQRDTAAHVEALEKLLAVQDESSPSLLGTTPSELWQSYSTYAMELGNQRQLLLGDDGAWHAMALQMELENPLAARALYGHLARQAQDETLQDDAENRLAAQLLRAGLVRTAHRLFADTADLVPALVNDLESPENSPARREALMQIGNLAQLRGEYAQAAEYLLLVAGGAKDDVARLARLRAAENLVMAGFREDARNQYRLLLDIENDPLRRQALQKLLGELP